jgi:hypothetical protein
MSSSDMLLHVISNIEELHILCIWCLQCGNPILSHIVERYKDGYATLLDRLGYAPRSAKHCSYDKLQQLVTHFTTQQNSAVQDHEVSCAYVATFC